MSTLSRELVSSNLFIDSLGAFLKPGDYSERASQPLAGKCLEADTGKSAARAEPSSSSPPMLVSLYHCPYRIPRAGTETRLEPTVSQGAKRNTRLSQHTLKKRKSSRPSSSRPNCLRGKGGQNPGNCLPKLIGFFSP